MRPQNDRRGFTLAELVIVVMIVGILASLAAPNLRGVILKADAANIVSDAHTISLAAYSYLSENGRFPDSAGYGTVPPQMAPYLQDNYQFNYKGSVPYGWFTITFPDTNNFWQTRSLGILVINYSSRLDLADAMRAHQGAGNSWGPAQFLFIYGG